PAAGSQFFGVDNAVANRSIGIVIRDPAAPAHDEYKCPLDVVCMNLSDWERPPAAISGVFSGALGAINLAAAAPQVNVTVGAEGTHPLTLPSGALTVAAAAQALETGIRQAAATRGFTGARVVPVGNQLLVIPGVRGASVSFGAPAGDALTIIALKLDAVQA